uniref:DUF1899 domain-containing protein n=1 Tax=Vannella robusta TaxID=1487602 RepID=A0A7S4MP39_9EUKA
MSAESYVIKANSEYFAVPWTTTGSVCVVPLDRHGAIPEETALIVNVNDECETTPVNEFNFSPHDNNLIAVAGQDGGAALYRFPEGGLTENVTQAGLRIQASEKRLLNVDWHPTASGIFFTVAADKTVTFWNGEAGGAELFKLPQVHKGLLTSTSWNQEASQFATCAKDKMLRIFDPRNSELIGEIANHTSPKSSRVQWMSRADIIVTSGFTRSNERELAAYDPRNLSDRLATHKLPSSSSTSMLFEDPDNSLLFVAGKGDGSINFFEIESDAPCIHTLSDYKSNTPQNGMTLLPKSCCNVKNCEIARVLKLSGTRVEPIRIEVPRQESSFFQDDLYPDTWDGQPTMSANEWAKGANTARNTVSLEPKD